MGFDAHLNGTEAAPAVCVTSGPSQPFTIGNSLIGVTSARTHPTRGSAGNKLAGVRQASSRYHRRFRPAGIGPGLLFRCRDTRQAQPGRHPRLACRACPGFNDAPRGTGFPPMALR